jgi:hypothetical protein
MLHIGGMTEPSKLDPAAIRGTLADMVAVPVLGLWGLLSFGPFVGLMRGGDPLNTAFDMVFLLTGLWGLLAGAVVLKTLLWSGMRNQPGLGLNRNYLTIYGALWCAFYLIFVQTPG